MGQLNNNYDALVLALRLALSAPDEQKAQQAVDIANVLAEKLSKKQIEAAKREALANEGRDDEWPTTYSPN
jgi:hypothetical protein